MAFDFLKEWFQRLQGVIPNQASMKLAATGSLAAQVRDLLCRRNAVALRAAEQIPRYARNDTFN